MRGKPLASENITANTKSSTSCPTVNIVVSTKRSTMHTSERRHKEMLNRKNIVACDGLHYGFLLSQHFSS